MGKESIKQVTMYRTPDGELFDKYNDAVMHEQKYIQRENLRQYLERRGLHVEDLLLRHVADYIVSEMKEG